MLVIASASTGKTHALAHRVVHLVLNRVNTRLSLDKVLADTFRWCEETLSRLE